MGCRAVKDLVGLDSCIELISGSFFPQPRIFNNFSALFSGLFRFVFEARLFVFNNFSALFFKKRIFLSHLSHFVQKIAAGRHSKETTILGQRLSSKIG
jgi:hypothetical protein